jgi:death-on-curing protein
MAEITWITQELACAIHDRQLDIHGGMAGIRDEGLLSSALARARNLFAYSNPKPDLAQLAAA